MSLAARLRAAVDPSLAPALRGDWDFGRGVAAPTDLVDAAVLIPVVTRTRPTVILTRRPETMRRHPGQVAFPGGRIDPGDDGPIAAALREAHEEIALPPGRVEVLGVTDAYVTGTGFTITPVLGLVPPDLPLVPCADEVAAVFEVPLDHLLDPANHELRSAEWRGATRDFYVIRWESHEVWGATAGIIVNLARRLA